MLYKQISYQEAIDFILPRHYSGRKPQIKYAFGAYTDNNLVACCTFGMPASPFLCKGICGEENKKYVIELNRICVDGNMKFPLSKFISYCLKEVSPSIVVSFSDVGMNHVGYIYQACNFIYTGKTKKRTDKYVENGKHPRHYDESKQNGLRTIRTEKHRYVYFSTYGYSKSLKKKWIKDLKYPIKEYPKDESKHYVLGEYQKQEVIDTKTGNIFKIGV